MEEEEEEEEEEYQFLNNLFITLIATSSMNSCDSMNVKRSESRLKLYWPRQKWTMNETFIFLKIIILTFHTLIPAGFQMVEAPSNHHLWYGVKLQSWISSNILHILQSYEYREYFLRRLNPKFYQKILLKKYRGLVLTCLDNVYTMRQQSRHHYFFYRSFSIVALSSFMVFFVFFFVWLKNIQFRYFFYYSSYFKVSIDG